VAAAGDSSAGVVQPVSGGYYADELHAELGLPLASGRPLIDDLQASVAGRFYRYDSFGSGGSYQLGLRWRPVRDVTLRGTRSTALHAPSVDQLYRGTADAFLFAPDPCAAPVPGSPTDLICQSQGVPAGGNGSFQTIQRAVVGGNPRLDAETADIYTLGVVFEPTGLPGLSVSLDYYHLALARSVDSLGAGFILDSCYAGGASQYCDRVHRNVSGAIDYVDDRYTNAGRTVTGGIDLSARWDVPSSIGRFQLAADGTWLQRYDRTDATGNTIAHAGNYDQLLAMPRLKANAAVTWTRHALRAGLALRWVGSYEECATTAGLSSTTGLCSPGINDPVPATRLSHTIGSWSSWDTFAGYELPSSLGKTTIMVGVSNLFDQNPPVTYNLTNSAADPSTYDFTGRYFFARLGQAF
jgi:outer membrane receptor protein involved in Fe transport